MSSPRLIREYSTSEPGDEATSQRSMSSGIGTTGRRLRLRTSSRKAFLRDSPQPAFEAPGLVRGEAATDPEKDFLDEIGRVVGVTGEPVGEVVDLPSIDTRDLFPGEWDGLRHGDLLHQRPVWASGS